MKIIIQLVQHIKDEVEKYRNKEYRKIIRRGSTGNTKVKIRKCDNLTAKMLKMYEKRRP